MPENALSRATGAGIDASIYGQQKLNNPFDDYSQAVAVARQMQLLESDKLGLAQKRLGTMRDVLSSIVSDPSGQNLQARMGELQRAGIPPDQLQAAASEFQATGGNPNAIRQIALRHLSGIASVQEKMQMGGVAAPQIINDGATQMPVSVGSGMSQGIRQAPGGVIMNKQSPSDASSIVTAPDPRDPTRNVTATKRQLQGAVGDTSTLGPAQPGTVTPLVPQPQVQGGISGPAAGQQQGQDLLTSDLAAVPSKITATRELQKAIQIAGELGPNATGPSAETEARLKEFLVTRNLVKPEDTNVVQRQELAKYLARYAAKSPNAARSDAAQAASFESSPNISQSLPAIRELAMNAIAGDRLEAAMPNAFGKDKPGAEYPRHKGSFIQQQDAAAYRFDFLSKDEQRRVYTEKKADLQSSDPQKKAGAERFLRSLKTFHSTIANPEGQ